MIRDVEFHLKRLGYELTDEGVVGVLIGELHDYNAVEMASYISLVTLARDVKEAGYDIEELIGFLPRAEAMLKILKQYKDNKMTNVNLWKNDSNAIINIVQVNENQEEWLEKVLNTQLGGATMRLAHFRGYD